MATLNRRSSGSRPRNPDPSASDSDHRSFLQVRTVMLDDLGHLQQSAVTGIGANRASFQSVVASATKPLSKSAAGAAINQEIHDPATETVARESPAITACA